MNQRHKKIKEVFSGLAVVLVELALMVGATAAFVSAFNFVDAKIVENNTKQSTIVASAAETSSSDAESAEADVSQKVQKTLKINDWQLILVNYDNKMPDTFVHTIVHQFDVDLDSRVVEPYRKMHDAAQKDNVKIWISSGYRSPEKQDVLFNQEIQTYYKTGLDYSSSVSKAEKSVARAGYSEHNTGLALDFNGVLDNFDTDPAFQWLQKHAQEYGFILRYPKDKQELTKIKYEPWHYRYVGVDNAKKMKELGMCLEEYINYLKENQSASN
jgi:zinc D-Ala-D-Ala carboxypeptidase